MWILPLLGYLGLGLGLAFFTLAIASGLYYLSELVEEHSVFSKKLLTRLIYAIITIQTLLLLVDKFPFWLSSFSIFSHVVYMLNLRRFPIVKLTDPVFLTSCALVLVNHYFWFRHFSKDPRPSSNRYPYGNYYNDIHDGLPTFTEIAAFFGVQVWLVPFSLFISLSAGEYVLPSIGSEYATGPGSSFVSPGKTRDGISGQLNEKKGRRKIASGMAKAAVNNVREWIAETGELLGFWKGDRIRARLA